MKTACLFLRDPTIRPNIDKAEKVSVKTSHADLEKAIADERLRCCDCLEAVGLVHRGDSLNHFRHHPRTPESPHCRFRSDERTPTIPHRNLISVKVQQELNQARETIAQLTKELEQARKIIVHLTVEAQQAGEIILHVEDGLKAA